MPAVNLGRLPEGIVVLPEPQETDAHHLSPRAWVEAVSRPSVLDLKQSVAEHLRDTRDDGEI